MTKYIGNDMLLAIEKPVDSGTYVTIGGSVEHTLTYNNEVVEVSDKGTNRWKSLLSAGDRMVTISMNGFISDDAAYADLETAILNDSVVRYQFAYGNSKLVIGEFHVDSDETSGARNTAQGFSVTFSSADEPISGALTSFLLDENDSNITDENNQYIQGT